MAQSLEGRAPFLTSGLGDLAVNLELAQRFAGDVTKVALRQVARRLLPADIIDRPKQGFVLPMRRWLKQWFDSRGPIDAYVAQAGFPGLNIAVVGRLIRADVADGDVLGHFSMFTRPLDVVAHAGISRESEFLELPLAESGPASDRRPMYFPSRRLAIPCR